MRLHIFFLLGLVYSREVKIIKPNSKLEYKNLTEVNFEINKSEVRIQEPEYNKLVYFSKCCALTNCISTEELKAGMYLNEGACPNHIEFCKSKKENPTLQQTIIKKIIKADQGELGTGYVMIDHGKKNLIVAFRGSSTRQDWFSDMEIYPTTYLPGSIEEYEKLIELGKLKRCDNCKMHRGFYRFKESLGRDFLKKIEKILVRYPKYNLIVTGHSLGAAMASMLGIELKLRGYNPLVLTFATPKMFNLAMKNWVDELFETERIDNENYKTGKLKLNNGYYRIIHNNDYIPMLPPFFIAAGMEIFIEKFELPHLVEDLCYKGMKYEKENVDDGYESIESSDKIYEWLHDAEHRWYFISLEKCKEF